MKDIIVVDKETGELSIPKEIIETIYANEIAIRDAKKANENFKQRLKEAMEEFGVDKIESEHMTVSYVAEHEAARVDNNTLKERYPEAYWNSLKDTPVKASVRVRLK